MGCYRNFVRNTSIGTLGEEVERFRPEDAKEMNGKKIIRGFEDSDKAGDAKIMRQTVKTRKKIS